MSDINFLTIDNGPFSNNPDNIVIIGRLLAGVF